MTHPDEALRLIDAIDIRLPTEIVGLEEALGMVPAEAPVSLLDQPPFDKATVDGFAYASPSGSLAAPGDSFRVVQFIAAGSASPRPLLAGECARIMTGAQVPVGAFAVHRLERAETDGERVRIVEREAEPNVVGKAANSRAGSELFPRRPLRAQDIGLLAANGISAIEAYRRPRVSVLSTGSELRSPGLDLGPGSIYDSNGPQLRAQCVAFGSEAKSGGIVADDEDALRAALSAAALEADLAIVSGGVSAGDFDFVPAVLESLGFATIFRGLAMRPGMPALLARRGSKLVYGMPGNPVSAFVNFEVLVKPLLRRLSGLAYVPPAARVRLMAEKSRREGDKVEFFPVAICAGEAFPVRYAGSTMLDALAGTDGLGRFELGQLFIAEGEEIDARLV
jgi:molybdopterin molybdotransferase